MAERGVTLKRTGEIIGGDKPLAVRTISAYIARGDLEAYGSLKGRRVTMRSIIAYQEGRRGEWRSDASQRDEPQEVGTSPRLRMVGRKHTTPSPKAAISSSGAIPSRTPKGGWGN